MLGLQLYTVRNIIKDESSAVAVIGEVKKMGYECVQVAGDMDTIALTINASKKAGIAVIGILSSMKDCEEQSETMFSLARSCGATDIGISSTIKTEAEAYDLVTRVNAFAQKAKENGFTFSYHNHSNEFIRGESGKVLMQILLEGFDTSLVYFMPDTYWLQHGGMDVRDFLEKLAGRVKILHLKDMKRTLQGTTTYAELGVGNINFPGIIPVAKRIGTLHFIVEQDICDVDPLISARISREYLKDLL